jgi:hypothetical protein
MPFIYCNGKVSDYTINPIGYAVAENFQQLTEINII